MHVRLYRAWLPVALIAALAAGWSTPALAQAGRISGRVRDASSGDAVKGATIVAEASGMMPGSFTAVSDAKGRFSMLGLRGGLWVLTVSAPGYFPLQGATRVGAFGSGPSMELNLTRAPKSAPSSLGTVDVKAAQQDLAAAEALMAGGRYDEAIVAFEAILLRVPALTSLNLEVGRAYRAKGDFAGAIGAYERVLEKDPRDETAQAMLGLTQLEAGDADAAERTLRTAAERQGAGAQAFNAMGVLQRARREPVDAARWFDKASKVEPTWAAPVLALGQLAMDRGDPEAAAVLFEKVIALDGDGPDGARARELLKK